VIVAPGGGGMAAPGGGGPALMAPLALTLAGPDGRLKPGDCRP